MTAKQIVHAGLSIVVLEWEGPVPGQVGTTMPFRQEFPETASGLGRELLAVFQERDALRGEIEELRKRKKKVEA